ncbi:endonuclease/exonuclease/phosphatase family protein [Phycicoccus sp. CSK15P-2]|uniref:endonuclease/exonuclease/phosphatase family protein n=1 Tax=Phycicoccus sp. CSK15P-2 TaxID=2807627 RepID=UPI00195154DD|nr:endonuclease/exonuclease/phosphatase family protein [Phycicoccus sp. CSK15P-2]MBM6403602.1 endonuclease/exonuclease/phosphatase family protein [Phycicoccus sp. CSK15P-2]MBM6405067.1 endonuclease/exonuclease/phosphatase family protein [Phycicoccus sp. CSK15P-2]
MTRSRRAFAALTATALCATLSVATPAATAHAATTSCAAKAVAVADRKDPALARKALVGVASYNILGQSAGGTWTNWPARRTAIADQIAKCLPDVVGLQEASQGWVRETRTATPRHISQYEDLTDLVNARTLSAGNLYIPVNRFRPSCSSTPEWNGRWKGQAAPWRTCYTSPTKGPNDNRLLYNSRTTRLLTHGSANLRSSTTTRRTVEWAVLEQRATKRRFLAVNTHLDAKATDAFRVAQMKQALGVVAKHRTYQGASLPTFVVGDLNSSRYTEARTAADVLTSAKWVDIVGNDRRMKASGSGLGWCRRLTPRAPSVPMAAPRFVNVVYNTTNKSTYSCTFPEGNTSRPRLDRSQWWKYNGSAIDYIFVSWGVRARTWETVVPAGSAYGKAKNPPSDHNMIMTWAYV